MRRSAAEDIAAFLSFSGTGTDREKLLGTKSRNWEQVLQWLDDHGLTFYFYQKLKVSGVGIPANVLARFEEDSSANRRRTQFLWQKFLSISRSFENAGVKYLVLKGFSHAPQFCPDTKLRHQGDLDYLVDEESLPAAQRLLEEAGYRLKPPISDQEFVYIMPNLGEPTRQRCYAPEHHAIELHLDIWDSDLNRLPMMDRIFSVRRAITHEISGFTFPALGDEDAFLLQVLHTCRHLFTYWIRMSCLYEIGYFLTRRASDSALWNRVQERVGDNPALRELTVVVSEMVSQLFAAPLPDLVRAWGKEVRAPIRVWIDHYARDCAFGDLPVFQFNPLPRSKLILFLHQQYQELCADKHVVRHQLIAPARIGRMRSAVKKDPSLLLSKRWWKRQRIIKRSVFHGLSAMRYAVEIPRWRWLNWIHFHGASSANGVLHPRITAKAKSA